MNDFSDLLKCLRSCEDVETCLRENNFRLVEELSPKISCKDQSRKDYSSEIWVRPVGIYYQAVRIDWKGHPTQPSDFFGHNPHIHFEMFSAKDFGIYLQYPDGKNKINIQKFSVLSGNTSNDPKETHGPLRVIR